MNRQLRGNLPPNEKANGKNRFLAYYGDGSYREGTC